MKKLSLFLFLLTTLLVPSVYGMKKDSLFIEASKIKNPIKRIDRLNDEIEKMWRNGDYFNGLELIKKTLKQAKAYNYQEGIASAISNQGIIYDYQGRYSEAIHLFLQALKIQISLNNQKEISKTYNNIGLVYESQYNYTKSLEFYNKSLKIAQKLHDLRAISVETNNIGIIYMHTKKYDLALKNLFFCSDYDKSINDQLSLSDSYNNIGLVYLDQKEFELSEIYFLKALKIREQKKDNHSICNSYINVASLAFKKQEYVKSESYFLKALEIAKRMGIKKSIQLIYENLSDISNKKNNVINELKYYKLSEKYSDSISNEANTIKQTQDEMQYLFDQKIQKEKLIERQKDLNTKHYEYRQKIIIWGITIIAILIFIFSLFLNNRIKIVRQQKKLIEEQKTVVELKNQEILDSITYAKRIQSAILPPERLVKEYLINSFILYKPKDIVAGDFYWIEPSNNQIIFAVADCTGHGVPGAMVSVICHNALNRTVREYKITDPGEILDKTREIIISEFEKSDDNVTDGMDISLCNLDLEKMELKWSGANNPLWLLKKGEKVITEIKPNKQPIGKYYTYPSFQTHTISVQKGDSLYLFTDGFADQFGGEDEKKFKSKQMKDMIIEINHLSMQKQRKVFEDTFENWKGNQDQVDDVCVIGILID